VYALTSSILRNSKVAMRVESTRVGGDSWNR